jgi:peptide/nickel transport system substrate-binding protein
MENRFGFRDFILVTLIVILIGVVLLSMKQVDRQWRVLQDLQTSSMEQTRHLAAIDRAVSSGVALGGNANNASQQISPQGDPFKYLREAENQPDFARGDWLIDNFGAKLKTMTYPVASDLYASWVAARVHEGLVFRDPQTLQYLPQLAREWTVSPDGMTLTFVLRKGVVFSDGTPLTPDDVVFSFDFLMNPKVNCPRSRAYYEKVKGVEKRGDDTLVFKMKEPYYEALDLCGTLSILPKYFYSKFTTEEINTNPGILMGTGPYRLRDPQSWRPGEKVELIRNERYWGVQPTFDRCVFLEVEDETAEETMFGNGEIDVFATQPEQYERLKNNPNTASFASSYEYESPMNGYAFIAWNEKLKNKASLFADKRVRRAMTMLTDRQRICHDVYRDYAKPTSGPFAMTSPEADPAIKPWPYDVAGAKALLAQVGYEDRDGSGSLKNSAGEPFKFKLTYPSKNATFDRVVLFLKDSYGRAGIIMEQDPVDWPVLQKKVDERDFEAISFNWSGAVESDLYQEFDSSQIADQGDNFMSYSSPRFDAAARKARITIDTDQRMKLWHEAHAALHDEQPYTFLYSRMSLRFMSNRIKNVKPSKIGLNYIYVYDMPMPWYVPKSLQKYKKL